MKNGAFTRAELAHNDLDWFAHWLIQQVTETPTDRESVKRLILDATQQLREIRQSYPPARPQIRG